MNYVMVTSSVLIVVGSVGYNGGPTATKLGLSVYLAGGRTLHQMTLDQTEDQ